MRSVFVGLGSGILLLLACGGGVEAGVPAEEAGSISDTAPKGDKLFNAHCTLCHGRDGTLGIGGAKNLTLSTLTKDEMVAIVSNGKGAMTAYKSVLSKAEINAVVDHVRSLPKEE